MELPELQKRYQRAVQNVESSWTDICRFLARCEYSEFYGQLYQHNKIFYLLIDTVDSIPHGVASLPLNSEPYQVNLFSHPNRVSIPHMYSLADGLKYRLYYNSYTCPIDMHDWAVAGTYDDLHCDLCQQAGIATRLRDVVLMKSVTLNSDGDSFDLCERCYFQFLPTFTFDPKCFVNLVCSCTLHTQVISASSPQ